MQRRKRKCPLSLEKDHPDSLLADAGELCSTVLLCTELSLSCTFDRDNDNCQATRIKIMYQFNFSKIFVVHITAYG